MQPALISESASLGARFRAIRGATEKLAEPLSAEDCALQSAPFTSPVKWHLGHTSWFFETFVLAAFVPDHAPPRPEYRVLFNSYYQAVGARHPRPERGLLSRPGLDEVRDWRRRVDRAMGDLLASAAGRDERVLARVELGLQHEQQHQELLLTDVKHLFARNPLRPAYRAGGRPIARAPDASTSPGASPGWRSFAGGEVEIGHDDRGGPGARPGFAFDNESPRHRVLVPPFELATRLVTNGEYRAFLEDGGCRRPELWLSEGFDFVQAEAADGILAPLYWTRDGGGFTCFTLDGTRPLDPDEPVCHLSAFEADAFARWAGARLPTEFEWEHAAASQPALGVASGNFVESGALHPRGGASLFGDAWQWTSSAYAPYPGYRAAEGALGEYNGKFMVNQLVLRGGSCVSPRSHLRATYRNFFHAHERWQFTGLRLARDAR